MRRKWLWIVGGFLLVVAAALAITILVPPAPRFNFLAGHQALEVPQSNSVLTQMQKSGIEGSFYTFKGDYSRVAAEAKKELLAAGFRDAGGLLGGNASGPQNTFIKGNLFAPSPSGARGKAEMPDMQIVGLFKDSQLRANTLDDSRAWMGKDKGWITVWIMGKQPKGPLERIREWLGL